MKVLVSGFRALEEDRKVLSDIHAVDLGGPTLTQQHMKDEVDINVIMRRFGATGALPAGVAGAVYGDFSGIEDYEDAVAKIEQSRRDFMMLPAQIREKFGNDPGRLVQYAAQASEEDFTRLFNEADKPGAAGLAVPVVNVSAAAGSTSGATVEPPK